MWTTFVLAGVIANLAAGTTASATILAQDGQAKARIVAPNEASPAERTAVRELAEYLEKATGARPEVVTEGTTTEQGTCIYVGPTRTAERAGITAGKLGPEEWVIRTVDGGLVLAGGRPRGTLYAVYHFLEDVVGVHWWNPWEESVPRQPTLAIEPLDRRGKPAFAYRDIYMLYGHDGGRFAARNRLNRQGDEDITGEFGGTRNYGPPYHVHTFYRYVSPDQHFKEHPEWFSLINGKRTAEQGQLCLTNPSLRQFFLRQLKTFINESRETARQKGSPPPEVFSVSQNDWTGACQCEACQAIAKDQESEAGPLLDFVNYLADAIRSEYPEVCIDTLAYWYTEKPPKTIKPRDNVIIRLCDVGSNYIKPITDPENKPFREHLLRWSAIARNLRIWDYAVTYGPYSGFPLPTLQTYAADFRFYTQHNVEGVFTEFEYPILADLRDLKIWTMMKLLEDPARSESELVQTFTDGFYGPAGGHIRAYLASLTKAAEGSPSFLSMSGAPQAAKYLKLDFISEATARLDQAEQAVKDDVILLRRVRHARMPLDRTSVVLYSGLMRDWLKTGHPAERMPVKRSTLAERYKRTWHEQIDLRLPESQRDAERKVADAEVASLTAWPEFVPLPEKFRGQPAGTVFDFTAGAARNWQDVAKVVPDPEAESGMTDRLILRDDDPNAMTAKYKLPMTWGLYDQVNKRGVGGATIKPEDVTGPGYHWYKMGTFPVGRSCYVYFFWSWNIQFDVDSSLAAGQTAETFDIWARIKFDGPAFPHGKPDRLNAISVERVVLTRAR
jgi:hypothetical protein